MRFPEVYNSHMTINNTEKGLFARLVGNWPTIPFMGFSFLLAWQLLAFSGGIWLSDIETDGATISLLTVSSSLSCGLVCLGAALLKDRFTVLVDSDPGIVAAGIVGAIGSMIIILCGPYYLRPMLANFSLPSFYAGGILNGISSAILMLKCASLYSGLSPRQVLIYAAQAQIVLVLLFFLVLGMPDWAPVEGGPSLSSMLAFILVLPVAASLFTLGGSRDAGLGKNCKRVQGAMESRNRDSFKENVEPGGSGSGTAQKRTDSGQAKGRASLNGLPSAFWKLLVMLFFFSLVVSMIRAMAIRAYPVEATLDGTTILLIVRLVLAIIVICIVIGPGVRHLNFGRIYSIIVLVLVIAIQVLPLIGVLDSTLNLVISAASAIFDFVLFCILVLICYQRRESPVVVVGFGYGVYSISGALGWLASGLEITDFLSEQFTPAFYLVIAGLLLLMTFALYSEKNFDRLFSADDSSAQTLQSALITDDIGTRASEALVEKNTSREQGRFTALLKGLAAQRGLTKRETDVLIYLAMGRGTDYIAEQLSISSNTVSNHIRNVYTKLGVHSRSELMDHVDGLKR